MTITHALRVVACALSILIFAGPAAAQNYPVKPVRMVVPFPPGGNTDIIARVFAPKMAENLGQQIVVENRGGAGSVIGTDVVAKAAPDGYTILMVSAAHTINPAMIKKLPYDSVKDFTPLALIADVPTAFVLHPAFPAKTVKKFIAIARAAGRDQLFDFRQRHRRPSRGGTLEFDGQDQNGARAVQGHRPVDD